MGCFDSVCSLSKLPIHYGDDIVAFYVCSGSVNSFSPEYRWYQMGFPLFGKYNDYGDIEEYDTSHINYNILENTVNKRQKYIKPMECCQYKDTEPSLIDMFMKNVSSGEQMLPSISGENGELEESELTKGMMKIKTHSGNAVHLVLIHRKVYDYVVEFGKSMLTKSVNADSINDYFKHRNMWSKDSSRVIRINHDMLINDINISSIDNIEEIDYDNSLSHIHRFLKCRQNDCFPSVCMYTNQVINEMYSTKADELSFEHPLIQSVLDYKFFRTARIALNLELVPHFSYASNQHRDNHDVRGIQTFHTQMAEIADTLIRDDEEEYEDDMSFFKTKLKEPTISDYYRIERKVTDLVTQSLKMQKSKNILDNKPDIYWLVSYAYSASPFMEVHAGNLIDAITWFITLQPKCVPIASWEISEEQYVTISVKNGIISQMKIEGYKPTHLINQGDA